MIIFHDYFLLEIKSKNQMFLSNVSTGFFYFLCLLPLEVTLMLFRVHVLPYLLNLNWQAFLFIQRTCFYYCLLKQKLGRYSYFVEKQFSLKEGLLNTNLLFLIIIDVKNLNLLNIFTLGPIQTESI